MTDSKSVIQLELVIKSSISSSFTVSQFSQYCVKRRAKVNKEQPSITLLSFQVADSSVGRCDVDVFCPSVNFLCDLNWVVGCEAGCDMDQFLERL